jgi:adenosylhomocysteinase
MVKNGQSLEAQVYTIPSDIDKEIARLKLEAMGVKIDVLTPEQEHYLSQWEEGT